MTTLWQQLQADFAGLVSSSAAELSLSSASPSSASPSSASPNSASPSSASPNSASPNSASPLVSLPYFHRLMPLWEQGKSLFEILTLPLRTLGTEPQAEQAKQRALMTLATALLQHQESVTQQPPTLAEAVIVMGQAAYLEQICTSFAQPNLQPWLEQVGHQVASDALQQQFSAIRTLNLEGAELRQAIVSFPTSRLASVLNRLFIARLVELGVEATAANQVAIRVALKTEPAILPALSQLGPTMQPWVDWYRDTASPHAHLPTPLERHLRIDAYLDECIAPRPREPIFNEAFRLQDIYVPLKAQPLTYEGEADFDQAPVDLADWVLAQLNDPNEQDQVLLLQGSFGRGKTAFCYQFADSMRQHLHPRWTPVFIPLATASSIQADFEAFLRQAVPPHLTQANPHWLIQGDVRFLFLLDGFSELYLDDTSSSLERFLQQIGKFQESCANHPSMGHRVLITGRSTALKTLERLLPPNLKRVELLPLDPDLQARWLNQWEQLTARPIAELKQILQDSNGAEHSPAFLQEPLILYFLAAMHRDGALDLSPLRGASLGRAKFLLYQQIFHWALTEHRPGLLNRPLSSVEIENLRRLLSEAGLWIAQTGSEAISLTSLSRRFAPQDDIQPLITELQQQSQRQALTNPLVTLSHHFSQASGVQAPRVQASRDLQQATEQGAEQPESSYLRFTHNSFGKIFASRRLYETLEDWSITLMRRHKPEPLIPDETLYWQIFDLLGCGRLMPEVTEYLMVLLNANPDLDTAYLFKRLEAFYLRWCAGQFIDAPPESFPQKSMRLLGQQRAAEYPLNRQGTTHWGQRQVDVYTGLNVLTLLLLLHNNTRSRPGPAETIAFYPCGRQGMPDFEPERLLRMIGYSHCVSPSAFRTIVGPYLSSANLSSVNLAGVNLSGVDLSGADLRSADLSGSHLRGAILSRANLVGASLDGANLSNADLRGANLIGAYLRGADLSSALLSGADLSGANLIGASLNRADLRDTDLTGAYLRGASLQTADLSRSYLIGAILTGACLSNANLTQVDLSDANLHGADLSEADLQDADLSGADLIGTYLNGASLCGANLCNANLNSADLIEADLCGADLNNANLIGAALSDQAIGTVRWSERTKWGEVRGLEAAINVPEALKEQLGLTH